MKRNIILLLALSVLSASQLFSSYYDREIAKMEFAERAKDLGDSGFEGCVNKNTCGFNGFYGATYSLEGLCNSCQFKQYPERFVACVFCRAPCKKFSSDQVSGSSMCYSKVQEILVESLALNNDWKHRDTLKMGIFAYLQSIDTTISRKYIAALGESKTRRTVFKMRSPGLYKGAQQLGNGNIRHVWSKELTIDPNDKKMVTSWDEAEKHAQYICEKYNIFGPETGEIMVQEVSGKITSFEEVVPKSDN